MSLIGQVIYLQQAQFRGLELTSFFYEEPSKSANKPPGDYFKARSILENPFKPMKLSHILWICNPLVRVRYAGFHQRFSN